MVRGSRVSGLASSVLEALGHAMEAEGVQQIEGRDGSAWMCLRSMEVAGAANIGWSITGAFSVWRERAIELVGEDRGDAFVD